MNQIQFTHLEIIPTIRESARVCKDAFGTCHNGIHIKIKATQLFTQELQLYKEGDSYPVTFLLMILVIMLWAFRKSVYNTQTRQDSGISCLPLVFSPCCMNYFLNFFFELVEILVIPFLYLGIIYVTALLVNNHVFNVLSL